MHVLFLRYFIKRDECGMGSYPLRTFLRPTNYDLRMITTALAGNTRHESTSIKAALQLSDMMIKDMQNTERHFNRIQIERN